MTKSFSPRDTRPPSARGRWFRGARARLWTILALLITSNYIRADQVEMKNGDRYVGQVLSLSEDVLVLRNDVLGTVRLPRGKVAQITMGTAVPAKTAAPASPTNVQPRAMTAVATNPTTLSLPQLNTNVSSIQQVREQVLNGASPEAMAKFNELAGGLLSGKLSLADIRTQARSAADQLRALKAELGEDSGFAVDSYLAILDRFLSDGKSPAETATNAPSKLPAKAPKAKSAAAEEEE